MSTFVRLIASKWLTSGIVVNRVTTILVDHIYHKCHNFFEKKILSDVSIPQVGSGCWGIRPLGRVGSGSGIAPQYNTAFIIQYSIKHLC